jgi:uncharacterized protein (TIGR02001 family)
MRKSILSMALLGVIATANTAAYAEEAASDWTWSANVALTSDYYVRGLSQNWHRPALQGGFDVEHSSGFYAGVWGSNVSPNTFPDASLEVDLYAGYGGEFGDSGIGYSVGLIGYTYPGGNWGKCPACNTATDTTPGSNDDNSWNTYEANFGLSYSYFSAQVSTTLGNWFGVDTDTGYDDDSKWTTYVELNAEFPLAEGWTLIGHIGHLNVTAEVADTNTVYLGAPYNGEADLDYTDYKIAVAKEFTLAGSEGWAAEVAYVGAKDKGYWNDEGWGGSSFNGRAGLRDLAADTVTLTVSLSF